MYINSFSAAGIASSVWNQAARTLTADPATDAGAAALVWGHAARQITSLAPAFAGIGALSVVANNVVLDLRPAASHFRMFVLSPITSLTIQFGVYDGTTFTGTASGASFDYLVGSGHSALCTAIKNVSGANDTMAWSGFDIG